jgi:ABC-type proline/glycine betaine transport system permease subunit
MADDQSKSNGDSARKKLTSSKVHIGLAAFGTLSAVAGIGVVINGGLEFNNTKVLIGVGIIVVSTILYVSMLFVAADE